MMTGFKIDQRDKRKQQVLSGFRRDLLTHGFVHYFGSQTKIFVKRYFFLLLVSVASKVF